MSSAPAQPVCQTKDLVKGAKIGLSLTAGASSLSAGAVLIVAAMVLYRVHQRRRDPSAHLRPAIKTHVDFYMISLLVSDLLQSVGGIINVYHVRLGRTECSPYCTAQGALKSLGEPSAALATMAITVHTFCVIFFHWAPPSNFLLPSLVVAGIWLYCSLYVGIAWALHHDPGKEFFQPVPYWCWVSKKYPDERISAEYFWLWFSAFASILLYVPLFLFVRGNIEVDTMRPWRIKWRRRTTQTRTTSSFNRVRQSLKMLLYPLVYLIIVLPLSVVRYITFIHGDLAVPMAGTFVGIIPFHMSGLLNVLLLIFTRPSILVFGGQFDTHGGTTTESRVTGGGAGGRYNISQAMEVSVHVQQDVMYGLEDLDGRHKVSRLDFSPRMSAKTMDSDPSILDIKPDHVHLDHMPRSPPRTRR